MKDIQLVGLSELQAAVDAGGALSAILVGVDRGWMTRIATRIGTLSLMSTRARARPRAFADPRAVFGLFRELGIVDLRIDNRGAARPSRLAYVDATYAAC